MTITYHQHGGFARHCVSASKVHGTVFAVTITTAITITKTLSHFATEGAVGTRQFPPKAWRTSRYRGAHGECYAQPPPSPRNFPPPPPHPREGMPPSKAHHPPRHSVTDLLQNMNPTTSSPSIGQQGPMHFQQDGLVVLSLEAVFGGWHWPKAFVRLHIISGLLFQILDCELGWQMVTELIDSTSSPKAPSGAWAGFLGSASGPLSYINSSGGRTFWRETRMLSINQDLEFFENRN